MARPDFRSQAAERLATERREYTPALMDLLKPEEPRSVRDVRRMPVERVYSNPAQPRQHFDEDTLADLAASIREHGVLQPVLVRPRADGHYQIVAGERRWRAAKMAGLAEIPVIIEQIDDEAALEIAIIENLQREDISPLEEAEMFARMTREHGYSLRKLATKLGKDKGYLENRLRLVDAPDDVRELVAVRSDTLSHAYELMKVQDPRKRRRLARQVAAGELSLVKLRQRIEGRPQPEPERPQEPDRSRSPTSSGRPRPRLRPRSRSRSRSHGKPRTWPSPSSPRVRPSTTSPSTWRPFISRKRWPSWSSPSRPMRPWVRPRPPSGSSSPST